MKRKGGRPAKAIDVAILARLARRQYSDAELAAAAGISPATMSRRMRNAKFREAIESGRARGKARLRDLQWRAAEKGSAEMLKFLGKQYLGQSDRLEGVLENRNYVVEAPRHLSKDDWLKKWVQSGEPT